MTVTKGFLNSTVKLLDKYLKENRRGGCVHTDNSFATYSQLDDDSVYIEDIYVTPGLRMYHLATKLADHISRIARSRGCTYLVGSVDKSSPDTDTSRSVLVAYGMTEWKQDDYFIYFRKRLDG